MASKEENKGKLIGYCMHCGQGNQISDTDEYLQETSDLDFIATMRCRCTEGSAFRRKTRAKDDAKQKIVASVQEDEHKKILLGLVEPIVEEVADTVTVNFGGGFVASMSLNKNDHVRITLRKSSSLVIE